MVGLLDGFDAALRGLARLNGLRRRRVDTPLGPVAAYEAEGRGDLPPLVFLHGLAMGCAAQFAPFCAVGRLGFRHVVAVDLPGHGASPPLGRMDTPALYEAVAAALDVLLPEPPVLYGNSLGGAVALHYGLTRPVRGLFLASPAGTPLPERQLRALLDRLLAAGVDGTVAGETRWWARVLSDDVRARFSLPHIRALVQSVRAEHGFQPERLRALATPTLLVWGEAEQLLPPEMLAFWERYLPATLERPTGVGHVPHVEAPLWTWRRLVRFAREVTGRAVGGGDRALA